MDTDLYLAALGGDADALSELELQSNKLYFDDRTILHNDSCDGHTEKVRFAVTQLANKTVLFKLDTLNQTPLHYAAYVGHPEVVEVLIDAARQLFQAKDDPHIPVSSFQAAKDDPRNPISSLQAFIRQINLNQATALSHAVWKGYTSFVKMLVEADPTDRHSLDQHKCPMYMAVEKGYYDIVKLICTACAASSLDGPGSSTALHAAILKFRKEKEEDKDVIRVMMDAARRGSNSEIAPLESLGAFFKRTDESGCTVLELALEKNYVDVVELILLEDPAYRGGVTNKNGLMRLIYKAIDMEYSTDMVKLLSQTYEDGISAVHQGVVALYYYIISRI